MGSLSLEEVVSSPEEFIPRLTIMHKQRQRLTRFSMNPPQEELLEVLQREKRVFWSITTYINADCCRGMERYFSLHRFIKKVL